MYFHKTAARNERQRQERISAESNRHQAVFESHVVTKYDGTRKVSDLLTTSLVHGTEHSHTIHRDNDVIKSLLPLLPPPPPQLPQPWCIRHPETQPSLIT